MHGIFLFGKEKGSKGAWSKKESEFLQMEFFYQSWIKFAKLVL